MIVSCRFHWSTPYFSPVLHNPSPDSGVPLYGATAPKLLWQYFVLPYTCHIIWEPQCDLQAYITSQMSQHAQQGGSLIEWKEHGIWCRVEQV